MRHKCKFTLPSLVSQCLSRDEAHGINTLQLSAIFECLILQKSMSINKLLPSQNIKSQDVTLQYNCSQSLGQFFTEYSPTFSACKTTNFYLIRQLKLWKCSFQTLNLRKVLIKQIVLHKHFKKGY